MGTPVEPKTMLAPTTATHPAAEGAYADVSSRIVINMAAAAIIAMQIHLICKSAIASADDDKELAGSLVLDKVSIAE
jgi:hypothetical protein